MRYLVGLLLLLYTAFSFAASSMQITDPQKAIFVQSKASTVKIILQSNPTTGYSWFLKRYNHFLIQPLSHTYMPPARNIPGAGGYDVWIFKAPADAFKVPQLITI